MELVSLAVENLTVSFPETASPVLENVNFLLHQGDFAVLCGPTGCGKTTLLRICKPELTPLCEKQGRVLFEGQDAASLSRLDSASGIGFVMQHPEQQIVTDKVWHELAFGLENMGLPIDVMNRKIAEITSYFDIEDLLDRDPATLSGGQKQLLNLASVIIMQPRLLLLDEPTAQLDPIAAAEFLHTLYRLNQDFQITILIAEHRLGDVLPLANSMLLMDRGTVVQQAEPRRILENLAHDHPVLLGMPAAVRIYHALGMNGTCPISVNDARRSLMPHLQFRPISVSETAPQTAPALSFSGVYFRYERRGRDILQDLSFSVAAGELYCLIGGNGAGKSTVLAVTSGLHRVYAGEIRIFGHRIRDYKDRSLHRNCVTLLPQDVQTVFLCNTVREELAEIDRDFSSHLRDFPFDLTPLLEQHPYDLSGGEQQIAALAKVMLTNPRLLLLDEPTKGLDAQSKRCLAEVLHGLTAQGVTVLMVTHDIEFAADHADRVGFLSRGQLVSADTPHRFFPSNAFYTTAVCRIARGFCDGAVTVDDIAEAAKQEDCS